MIKNIFPFILAWVCLFATVEAQDYRYVNTIFPGSVKTLDGHAENHGP